MNPTIPLERDGVFLFTAPAKVTVQLNRDCLVVFSAPTSKWIGLAHHDGETPIKDFLFMLEGLLQKFTDDFHVTAADIQVKFFGANNPSKPLREGLHTWVKGKKLSLTAEDTGRNVMRHLVIDGSTGKVGVTYAEAYVPEFNNFLSTGSAQERDNSGGQHVQVLLLSSNRVTRRLAQQAIEEYPPCLATIPKQPQDLLTQGQLAFFPWTYLFVFEDLGSDKPLEKWIKLVKKKFPGVNGFWVGKKVPLFAKGFTRLAPLTPESVHHFKDQLKDQFNHLDESITPGFVIPFPKKKAKK
jgi:hypothetical protein